MSYWGLNITYFLQTSLNEQYCYFLTSELSCLDSSKGNHIIIKDFCQAVKCHCCTLYLKFRSLTIKNTFHQPKKCNIKVFCVIETYCTYDSKFLLLICTFNKENIAVKKQKTKNCKTNAKLRYAQGPKLAYWAFQLVIDMYMYQQVKR